jgi:hypothetical protein
MQVLKNIDTIVSSLNALMTSAIVTQFLRQLDVSMGAANGKVPRFYRQMSNTRGMHSVLTNVKVIFFSPTCTSQLQLLDLGVIHLLKAKYRKSL